MPSFIEVVVDAFSVVDELRVQKQASCWVIPKSWDTVFLWSFVCFDSKNVWILGQVVADTTIWYFV